MKQYNQIITILKEIEDKTKNHLKNAIIAGGVGSVAGVGTRKGLRRGIAKEIIMQRRMFKKAKQYIHERWPNKGDADYLWNMYKSRKAYKKHRGWAYKSILKTGAISGATAILLYGFYEFVKEFRKNHKNIPIPDLP